MVHLYGLMKHKKSLKEEEKLNHTQHHDVNEVNSYSIVFIYLQNALINLQTQLINS